MSPLPATFAPFIYFVRHVKGGAADVRGPALEHCYNLWHLIDGAARFGPSHLSRTLRGGGSLLTEPGIDVALAPTAVGYRLACDLCFRPRARRGDGPRWAPIDWRPERRFVDIFGVNLPMLLPSRAAGLVPGLLIQCNRDYWIGDLEHAGANNALGRWLLGLVAELRSVDSSGAANGDLVHQAERLMDTSYHNQIRVVAVARLLGVSEATLRRHYHAHRGFGPGAYLRRLRLAYAQDLLRADPTRPVGDIARLCGLSSGNSLLQAFQREFGCTPGQWRRQFLC